MKDQKLKDQIQQMPDKTRDQLYEYFAGKAGLFGQAFFGHHATKQEKYKLQNIWKQTIKHTTA